MQVAPVIASESAPASRIVPLASPVTSSTSSAMSGSRNLPRVGKTNDPNAAISAESASYAAAEVAVLDEARAGRWQ